MGGIYMTEFCSSADEMSSDSSEDLYCMLLCRTILGNVLKDDAILPDTVRLLRQVVGGTFDSVLGNREQRFLDVQRQFIIYDKDQVYPEFLIWYRRVYHKAGA